MRNCVAKRWYAAVGQERAGEREVLRRPRGLDALEAGRDLALEPAGSKSGFAFRNAAMLAASIVEASGPVLAFVQRGGRPGLLLPRALRYRTIATITKKHRRRVELAATTTPPP